MLALTSKEIVDQVFFEGEAGLDGARHAERERPDGGARAALSVVFRRREAIVLL